MKKQASTPLITRTRREVACEIFPNNTPRQAVNRLTRWIHQDPVLLSRLMERGYSSYMRCFSPNIQRVLQAYIGY